jgi:hypothetical protein
MTDSNEVEWALLTALGPLVTGAVHPMYLPDDVTYPAIRYQAIVIDPQNTMCGESDLDNVRMRIDVFSKDWDQMLRLRRAVRTAMGSNGTFAYRAICVGEYDVPEPEQKLFHKALDFSIWAKKPAE